MKMDRRARQRSVEVILASLLVAFAVAGCTSKPSNEPPDTVHLVTPAKIKGIDPAFADDLYSGNEAGRVYEGLLQYHYLKRPYALIANLAESMPAASQGGRSFTFRIKKGVLFQDDPAFKATQGKGRELTAEDFVYSFKRLADPKLSSPGWWIFDGKILGLNEWREEMGKAASIDYDKPVEGLKALDRYTLQIRLTQRSYQFLYALAMPFASVVPREAVETYSKEFINHPVGTGPFRVHEYNPASKLVYVRNPTYRKELYPSEGEPGDREAGLLEDAGKPLPRAERLVVEIITEDQPRWLKFMKGQLDASGIPKDNFAQAISKDGELTEEMRTQGMRLVKAPGLDVTHDSFNMTDPTVGKNKLLRQAISLALDSAPVIELFFNGRAVPAQGPIPPGIAGYDAGLKNPYRQFNLDRARELLAKAGYPEGKGLQPLEFNTLTDSTSRQMTEYLTKSLTAIGVTLKVNSYSWPEFQAAVKNKKGHFWGFAWGADYPDGENFLQLFYSKNASPGPNDANYSNPEYDRLYDKSLTLSDGPERTALYKKMAQIVIEDCPWVFGVHRIAFGLTHKWLRGYKLHDFDHGRAKYFRVDPALRN